MEKKNLESDPVLRDAVNESLDAVLAAIESNPIAAWGSDEARLRAYHHHLKKRIRAWESQHKCIFLGCANRSIKRSHTIAKHSSLSRVAVNGHVYAPQFNHREGRVTVQRIGIGQASTFPGFCLEHENLFRNFEQPKQISSETDFALQSFRVICRELKIATFQIETMELIRSEVSQKFNEWGRKTLIAEMKKRGLNEGDFPLKNFRLETPNMRSLDAAEEKRKKHLGILESDFYKPFIDNMKNESVIPMTLIPHKLDRAIPVTLAGIADFKYPLTDRWGAEVNVILNILPEENETVLSAMVPHNHNDALLDYFKHFAFMPLASLCMIESWMICGSDHWFLSPAIWENLGKTRQKQIEDEVSSLNGNIATPLDFSIFDDIRKEYLEQARAVSIPSAPPWFKQFLSQESEKLSRDKVKIFL